MHNQHSAQRNERSPDHSAVLQPTAAPTQSVRAQPAGLRFGLPAVGWFKALVAVAVVGLFQFALIFPLQRTMDLPAWDELNFYALPGARLVAGSGQLQSIEYGPLYSLLYAPVIAQVGLIDSIFVMRYLLSLAVTLLLLLFLAVTLRSWAVATVLAMVWAAAQANVLAGTMVYHLALVLLLTALIVSRVNRLAALLCLLLAGFVRPEYFFLTLCYAVYLAIAIVRSPDPLRTQLMRLVPRTWPVRLLVGGQVAMLFVLAINIAGWRFSAGRSWLAFQQHYAFAQVVAGRYNLDPWNDFPYIIARDLPGAASVAAALWLHPVTVAGHALSNLIALPRSLFDLVNPVVTLQTPLIYALVFLAVLILCFGWLRGDRPAFARQLHQRIAAAGDAPALALLAPLTLLPNLLVSLRFAQYVLVLLPFLLFGIGACWVAVMHATGGRQLLQLSVSLSAPIIAVALLALLVVGPRPYVAAQPAEPRYLYAKVAQLQPLLPQGPYMTYGAALTSYIGYLCQNCRAIYPLNQAAPIDLAADIERYRPSVVSIDGGLLASPFFEPAQLAVLTAPHWLRYTVANEVVYVHAGMVTDPPPANQADDFVVLLQRNWQAWFHDRASDDRYLLRLPGQFWIYTAQPRRVLVRFASRSTAVPQAAQTPTRLAAWVNTAPATVVAVSGERIVEIELELAPGYNQIWFAVAGPATDLSRPPVEPAVTAEMPPFDPLEILTVQPLP